MDMMSRIIAFIGTQSIGFLLGVAASFVASMFYARWTTRVRRTMYGSLAGVWIEANNLLEDRPFAVCEFFFSPSDGELKFLGDSYDNKASVYYKWWSIVLWIDDTNRTVSYIYETQRVGETKKDEGFGCIHLSLDRANQKWEVRSGYFLDLQEAKPRFSRMLRFEAVACALKRDLSGTNSSDRRLLIQELIKLRDSANLRNLFGWSRDELSSDTHGKPANT